MKHFLILSLIKEKLLTTCRLPGHECFQAGRVSHHSPCGTTLAPTRGGHRTPTRYSSPRQHGSIQLDISLNKMAAE